MSSPTMRRPSGRAERRASRSAIPSTGLASNKRSDILAARDRILADPKVVTPMTMMVLAIRLYDVGLRDDAVFWSTPPRTDISRSPKSSMSARAGSRRSRTRCATFRRSRVRSSTATRSAMSQTSRRSAPRRSPGSSRIPTRRSSWSGCRREQQSPAGARRGERLDAPKCREGKRVSARCRKRRQATRRPRAKRNGREVLLEVVSPPGVVHREGQARQDNCRINETKPGETS